MQSVELRISMLLAYSCHDAGCRVFAIGEAVGCYSGAATAQSERRSFVFLCRDKARQNMQLKLDKNGTLRHQIARAIRQAVLDGRIAAKSRLPSASALAVELPVSRH
jgi:Bacterial regulatory proteins, gntR family